MNLYDVAKRICHEHGYPWTDPRTLITHKPPRKNKRTNKMNNNTKKHWKKLTKADRRRQQAPRKSRSGKGKVAGSKL